MPKNGENLGEQIKLICLPASPGTAGLYTGSGDHRTHSCPQTRAQIWTSCQWPPSFRSPWWRRSAAAAGPSLCGCKHGCTEWEETFSKKKTNSCSQDSSPLPLFWFVESFDFLHIVTDDTLLTGSRRLPMCVRWRNHVLRWELGCWTSDEGCEGTQRGGHKDRVWIKVKNLSFHFMERICWRGSCTET